MVTLTASAIHKLKALILEHPEDPVVRLFIRDVDESRLGFSIVLDSHPHEGDEVQDCDGVTVAVEGQSAPRMNGITVDYVETDGFTFRHPEHGDDNPLRVISMN